jgi:cell division protein FtsQ
LNNHTGKSVIKVEKTYLNFVLTVSVLIALYLVSQNWKRQLVLRNVDIHDASILRDNEVKALAGVRYGSALYGLSLSQIAHRVEKNPFVKRAIVVRALPYDLKITVRERVPVALLILTSSDVLSIDKEGVVLPLPLGRKNGLPVITNVDSELAVGDTARGDLMQAVKFICDADDVGGAFSANIAEVKLDGDNLIAYTTTSSLPIVIGKGDLHRKLLYLHDFLKESTNIDDQGYSYVDLRFDGQIVVGQAPNSDIRISHSVGR